MVWCEGQACAGCCGNFEGLGDSDREFTNNEPSYTLAWRSCLPTTMPVGYLESLSKKKLGMLFPMQLGHMVVVVRIVHRSMALHAAAITAAAAAAVAVLVFAWQVELS
jgi:hypothetical protein